jgi:hypothetical protein
MAVAPQVPAVPGDVVYGTGRKDESGRVGDRAMIGVLGRQRGDRLTLTAAAGVVIARRDPAGMVTTLAPSRTWSSRPRCGAAAGCGLVITCCRLPRQARTCWPPTRSRWWTRRCGRTPRSPLGTFDGAVDGGVADREGSYELGPRLLFRSDSYLRNPTRQAHVSSKSAPCRHHRQWQAVACPG